MWSRGAACAWFSNGISESFQSSPRYEDHAFDNKSRCSSHMEQNIPHCSVNNSFFPESGLFTLPAELTGTPLVPAQQRRVGSTILRRGTGSLRDAGWLRGHLFVLFGEDLLRIIGMVIDTLNSVHKH